MRLKWFQYEITLAAYCFVWWEKAFVHVCVLGVLSLFAYGFWRQACALAPAASQLAAKYLPRCDATLGTRAGEFPRRGHNGRHTSSVQFVNGKRLLREHQLEIHAIQVYNTCMSFAMFRLPLDSQVYSVAYLLMASLMSSYRGTAVREDG